MTPAQDPHIDPMSVERICSAFWAAESKFSLLSWTVNGVYPWPLVRMQLYYKITQQVGLFGAPHPAVQSQSSAARAQLSADSLLEKEWTEQEWTYRSRKLRGRAKQLLGYAGLSRLLSPVEEAPRRPYGLIMATRRVNGSEPYTDALRKELGDQALLLDRALDGKPADGAFDIISLQDLFRKRYGRRRNARFAREHQAFGDAIRKDLSEAIGVDVGDVGKACRWRVADFISLTRGYEIFFSLNPVDTLFLTNSYSTNIAAALFGAQKNGARIVELQHGFISPFHLGYSWPERPYVPYKPDELWCFGDFWHESTPLPGQTRARVIGAPYVQELAKLGDGTRQENLVVFTSQGVIGPRLFEIALETARRRPDKQVIFRLHPSEALEDFEALLSQAGPAPANLSLSHKNPNIFALLSKTAIQVGAFSTTLFEGMSLGCRTVVIDLPGCEYMRPVIGKGDVLFVRNVGELVERLDSAPLAADPEYYYAKPAARLL